MFECNETEMYLLNCHNPMVFFKLWCFADLIVNTINFMQNSNVVFERRNDIEDSYSDCTEIYVPFLLFVGLLAMKRDRTMHETLIR